MLGFKSPGHAQRSLPTSGPIAEHFRPRRHRRSALTDRPERRHRCDAWQHVTSGSTAALGAEARWSCLFLCDEQVGKQYVDHVLRLAARDRMCVSSDLRPIGGLRTPRRGFILERQNDILDFGKTILLGVRSTDAPQARIVSQRKLDGPFVDWRKSPFLK